MPSDIEEDVLCADELGNSLKEDFIRERLEKNSKMCFFDPIKRQKLKNMENNNKSVSLTTSQVKLIQYQEQSDLAFRLLIKSQMQYVLLDLDMLLSYSLSPVPHCLGAADGFFA